MKQTLQLRLGQQLTMTPQLQQAIKLLQLSTLELQYEIQEALESNLMLEVAEDDAAETDYPAAADSTEPRHDTLDAFTSSSSSEVTAEDNWNGDDARVDNELHPELERIPDNLPLDSDWSDTFDSYLPASSHSGSGADDDYDPFAQHARPQTLHDHLDWQLNLARINPHDRAIAEALVDAIDANGYLRLDLADVAGIIDDAALELADIEAVLQLVQSFDPAGVGARDLRECLTLQLRYHAAADSSAGETARQICAEHFDALARNDLDELRRLLRITDEELAAALTLIRSLNPRPGSLISDVRAEYVIPDVLVRKQAGRWKVELNPETAPRLRVNADYAKLIRRSDQAADNTCLKAHLQEARWFIKSLTSRNDTVLRVAIKIVELQQAFFELGEEAMRPLVLRDVAEALELHESTVSRVTTQKYMHTPRGMFEFKYFFSSYVSTTSGGECSSTAIRALIRKLVATEVANKPLSDSKIVNLLSHQGIQVARRTVAKYREAMGIPPSNERKRLL
ncbi:RNA polymerase factor sigma-54 [Rhodoferax sp. 4810]|uniref:RNA polymerase sigma-54 factor n=1 Tax=Thiospirillum jenense TaxID=1653858 RepID=A0A839HA01_9GAMM|nr:RNA polymerase factor sigma-54 [Thiospirillum jenense]MBB1073545.1 RNA polymerase factor sigma-54 [Rhodoferax jenense]MBB1126033.1 RNA polymerase factor sigma-54 [Thiospirillum jenense]